MKAIKILTATAVAAALVAGGVAGPAMAVGEPPVAGIDLTAAPGVFDLPKSGCAIITVPTAFGGGGPDGIYNVSGSITSGQTYPISLSQYTVDEVPNTPIALTGQICDAQAGIQTITVTVEDYQNKDAAGNPTVTAAAVPILFTAHPDLQLISASGKLKKNATAKVIGTADHNAIGAVVKVYYKKTGAKKYKYVGKTRIKAYAGLPSLGKWVFKTKKLGLGKMYVKVSGTTTLHAEKTKNIKLVKR